MNAKRTDPRVHCFQRPLAGGYVRSEATTPERLRQVFDAERERLAAEAKPRRRRRPPAVAAPDPKQAQLQLVA
ncbi:hypothetical protein [Acidovorax sp. SUPP2825]|uniref:hypothetical protein n=1 Tax=Acidovorax sp. SUPP2825 TaxID=2920879 RepID=UPI0023DE3D00|nr:hypothetical protein [Acidovorax sp. SUPP2825]GKS93203.1 hypothetical protein AVAK2825_01730 [Acidovorax sp. SUPP2825]